MSRALADGRNDRLHRQRGRRRTLHLLDGATAKEKTAPKLPPGSVGGLSWHRGGKDLGFSLVSARSPADVYSLDIASGKVDRWTESETGGLNTARLAEPELVRWKSFDGRQISGFLYRPPAKFTGKRPVVITIHGGRSRNSGRPPRPRYFLDELGVAAVPQRASRLRQDVPPARHVV
jgi:dipeptidyl aminopeptidase/acylaminoacyl peptidase